MRSRVIAQGITVFAQRSASYPRRLLHRAGHFGVLDNRGAVAGLGRVLNVAQQDIYPAMILVAMAAVAVLGWGTTRLLDVIESRAMPWLPVKP
jgi:hypothetical protein